MKRNIFHRISVGVASSAFILLSIGCADRMPSGMSNEPSTDPISGNYIKQLVGFGFNKADIEQHEDYFLVEGDMKFSKEALDQMALRQQPVLAKTTQDRWDAGGLSIKNLDEIEAIRVQFDNSGVDAVGTNWLAASREALTGWNNITGCSVRFTEVTSAPDVFITATLTSGLAQTDMRPDQVVNSTVEVNRNINSNSTWTHAHKVQIMKHELSHTLNLLHTDRSNNGGAAWVYIKGTPTSETASIFNSTISSSAPARNFSTGDLAALRYLYPEGARLCRISNNDLIAQGPGTIVNNVVSFQQDGDWFLARLTNNDLVGKNGLFGAWGVLANNVTQFIMSGNRIGIVKTDGSCYVKDGLSGIWAFQSSNVKTVDVDGNRIGFLLNNGDLKARDGLTGTLYLLANNISSFELEGNRIAALTTGKVLQAKDGITGTWYVLISGISQFDLEGNSIAALTTTGTLKGKTGITGIWGDLISGVSSFQLESDRVGALVGNTLYVKENGLSGTWVTEHTGARAFFLKDYYISVITTSNVLVVKYDMSNAWQTYTSNVSSLQQWR